jgi:hypothetical protein
MPSLRRLKNASRPAAPAAVAMRPDRKSSVRWSTSQNNYCTFETKLTVMPIPFLIWGAIAATSSVWGALNTASAVNRLNRAKERYAERRERYDACLKTLEERRTHASGRVESLGRTRLQAVVTLGNAVRFLERARVKERDLLERFSISEQTVLESKTASVHAGEVLSGLLGSVASGLAASATAYGMVGSLAAASTGTAISTLSGTAATNATLAWLGGGALAAGGGGVVAGTCVLGGVMAAPALLCTSFVMHSQAEKVETETERNIAEMDVNEAGQWLVCEETNSLIRRVNELEESTLVIATELDALLASAKPNSEEDAFRVAKIASALGRVLEQNVLSKA